MASTFILSSVCVIIIFYAQTFLMACYGSKDVGDGGLVHVKTWPHWSYCLWDSQ